LENFYKFPRTRHLLDAGGSGVSRDDLVMSKDELNMWFTTPVIVEEKIDGSNLGISITKDYEIQFQNRSKQINSATHMQWKGLDNWVKQTPGLWQVLTSDDIILFGEWCFAKHSIHYTQLPGWFVAFDIYVISQAQFVSRAELETRLEGTGIPIIHKISEGVAFNKAQLIGLLETNSQYYKGKVEGIYLRIDTADGLWSKDRGKIVRPDFIQGIEDHWQKSTLVKNEIRY